MEKIVTRESMQQMIDAADAVKKQHIVGRALIAIFDRQTAHEQSRNDTEDANNIGFSAADAKTGSITAKFYMKNRVLLDWQLAKWLKPRNGFARITKYHKQLNEVANEKVALQRQQQYRQASNGG